jgi:hypothetical protein
LRPGLQQIDSHHWVNGLNELQIRERSHLSNDELVAQLRAVGPKAVERRWRTPPPARNLPLPFGPPIGWAPLKYLLDGGFTRDVWAHRIDIHIAIDRPMNLTADHDGRLVADMSPSGPPSTASRSTSCSRGPPAASSAKGSTANASRSTPSTSSAPSPVACPARVSSATHSHSEWLARSGPWRGQIALAIIDDANELPIDFAIALSEMLTDYARG